MALLDQKAVETLREAYKIVQRELAHPNEEEAVGWTNRAQRKVHYENDVMWYWYKTQNGFVCPVAEVNIPLKLKIGTIVGNFLCYPGNPLKGFSTELLCCYGQNVSGSIFMEPRDGKLKIDAHVDYVIQDKEPEEVAQ